MSEDRCEARIYERPHYINWHRCRAKAKGVRQKHLACCTHLRAHLAPYWMLPSELETRGAG